MITYNISAGQFYLGNIPFGKGYSGKGPAQNDPLAEELPNAGPIPEGMWQIGAPQNHPTLGEYVLALTPEKETLTFGRTDFYIHGDNPAHPGQSSDGCIVADKETRSRIWQVGDRGLQVIAGNRFVPADLDGEISV